MPTIHVARDGAKLGEFSLEQIQEGLRTGQFRPTDLGWQTGMSDWRPLAEFVASTAPVPGALAVPATPAAAAAPESGLPWENRQQLGFFKAFFDTVSALLMKPSDAFTMMKREGGLTDPLLFGMIGGSVGTIASILFQIGLQSLTRSNTGLVDLFGVPMVVGLIVLSPLWLALWLFIGSGILHLCLMMLGGANRPFETTFRVVCFSGGSTQLFNVIPICGAYVAPIYYIVLVCIGLTRAQETTIGKALLAIFLPIIVCCGLMTVLFVLIVGSSGELFKSLRP